MKRLIFCHVKLHVLVIKVRDELIPRPAPALLCGEDSTIDTVNSLMPNFFAGATAVESQYSLVIKQHLRSLLPGRQMVSPLSNGS